MSTLRARVDDEIASLPPGPIAVAYSGGMDSTVLLHCLAAGTQVRQRGLRAIHVNHQLHPDSEVWAAHCAQACEVIGVALDVLTVQVARNGGSGLEAAAREARHAAIQSNMRPGEMVAFAHHQDDQAETVLLRLLRGAGPEGLGAMRTLRRFGPGLAWRPLLDIPRQDLLDHARQFGLAWLEDPSNRDTRIDRNYLRESVIPLLRLRWPSLAFEFSQSARWMRSASDFIEQQAGLALATLRGTEPSMLDANGWLNLPEALRDSVLRQWLRSLELPPPTRHQAGELERQLQQAGPDKLPCIRWPGAELRRYREWIHAMPPAQIIPAGWRQSWDGNPLQLPAGLGTLTLLDDSGEIVPLAPGDVLSVGFRRGGERIQLHDRPFHHELRDLLQKAGIPPWQRNRLPLVLDGNNRLLAVADRWLGIHGLQLLSRIGARIAWKTR